MLSTIRCNTYLHCSSAQASGEFRSFLERAARRVVALRCGQRRRIMNRHRARWSLVLLACLMLVACQDRREP
ncbi:conserved hypothetical protein, partial [Ricinus communis]